jgi:magnesium chelatase family protein
MDLLVEVERPDEQELRGGAAVDSATARARVAEARARQLARLRGAAARCNGDLDAGLVRARVRLEQRALAALGDAYTTGALSARGRHRVLRVAQTIADLDGHDRVSESDVLLALSLRQRSAGEGLPAA